ncbi:CaiB/BaiF CoA transferase family protein [Actinokineospora pegani]|uniref:CaiB/BaiF CoA transferase family protein n=1 Tax=Actinokineospora pegani TaxID=2654637 RepID=UPI0012EA737A|nr:CoA transferase [Actinokineospora pegani]
MSGHGPLAGITVLELGSMYAAPTAGRMLRDFGAELLKVEDPVSGDGARHWVPQKNGHSLGFARINAGKRSLGVDLRSAGGQDLVRRLAAEVDVVVESFRPGRLEAWGLGWDALREVNPRLVLTRVTGFGQTGPHSARPGFGTVAEVMSGFAFINGWPDSPPTSPPFGFADSIAGIAAAYGTAMSLYQRERTGLGDCVDVALYEPLMFILGDLVLRYTAKGEIATREGNSTGAASPRGVYQAADGGWLAIAASSQRIAERLFVAMGRPEFVDDPRYRTNADRLANNAELQAHVTSWVGSMTRPEVLAVLERHEVVAAAVNDAKDITEDPHFVERTLVDLHTEALGAVKMPGPVLHLGGYDGPGYDGVPAVGEHTDEVLTERLGLGAAELADLRAAKVIR